MVVRNSFPVAHPRQHRRPLPHQLHHLQHRLQQLKLRLRVLAWRTKRLLVPKRFLMAPPSPQQKALTTTLLSFIVLVAEPFACILATPFLSMQAASKLLLSLFSAMNIKVINTLPVAISEQHPEPLHSTVSNIPSTVSMLLL